MAEQSPVDIPAHAPIHADDITWSYRLSAFTVASDGYAIQVAPEPGNSITARGQTLELTQFHFHSPAEHTFAGARAAMELHFVHTDSDGALAVMGVILSVGAHHPTIERILTDTETLDPSELLPADRRYVTYRGSLTVPPYTEGVAWRVLTNPIELSTAQLAAFRARHHDNARPIQPMSGRRFF